MNDSGPLIFMVPCMIKSLQRFVIFGCRRVSEDSRHGSQEAIIKVRYTDKLRSYFFFLIVWRSQISMNKH